jgi:hypothetical protein
MPTSSCAHALHVQVASNQGSVRGDCPAQRTWLSVAGFQSGSKSRRRLAPTRFKPTPPALDDSRKHLSGHNTCKSIKRRDVGVAFAETMPESLSIVSCLGQWTHIPHWTGWAVEALHQCLPLCGVSRAVEPE